MSTAHHAPFTDEQNVIDQKMREKRHERIERLIMSEEVVYFSWADDILEDDCDITVIAKALARTKTLRSLTFDGCICLDERMAADIATGLTQNKTLRELRLIDVDLESARPIAPALLENSTLRELDLRDNDITTDVDMLAIALEHNRGLQVLNLSGNYIGTEGCKLILNSLQKNDTLQELDVGYIGISASDITWDMNISTLFRHNNALQCLKLNGNTIEGVLLRDLSDALRQNRTLLKLYLHNCGIGDDAANTIAATMAHNNILKELHLKANNIGDAGALGIADALRYDNSSLALIYLSDNNVCDFLIRKINRLAEINLESTEWNPVEVAKRKRSEFGPTLDEIYYAVRSKPFLVYT